MKRAGPLVVGALVGIALTTVASPEGPLADAFLALWFFLPAYFANPMAALLGRGTPIDFRVTLRDGHRLFGDGKTWVGLAGGVAGGVILGLIENAPSNGWPALAFGPTPVASLVPIVGLSLGALLGDLAGAFIKRRFGKPRGARVPILDQYDFVLGAIALVLLLDPSWWLAHYWTGTAIYSLALIIVITPVLHRAVNLLGYRMGTKREPW